MKVVRYKVEKDVAWLAMNNPPLNALSHELRKGIVASLDRALADAKVRAVIIIGNERAFSGGADIKEFAGGGFYADPFLPAVVDIVEGASKPVIAAIGGACMGGGLELALGCHYRVARPDAKIAFPEVKLGLIPGAGGTQRFPRLVGLEAALNMIVSGATVPASMFKGTALFDSIAKDSLEDAARDFAARLVKDAKPIRRVRDLPCKHPQAEAFLQFARTSVAAVSRGLAAPARAIEAVGAAVTQNFDAGIATERKVFGELMFSEESKALRHAFFAERAASKVAGITDKTSQRKIASVAVVGAGTMGGGIAMNFANVGIPVTLLEAKQEALDRGVAGIRKQYEGAVAKGKLKPDDAAARAALIIPSLDYTSAAGADLVIEAVFEDLEVKKSVFRALDAVMKRGAILATNTSTLNVDRIAAFTKRPGDVLGMHFFSPANVMKLLEIVRGAKTAPDVLMTAVALARKIGKVPVVVGNCHGFVGNRMLARRAQQTDRLLLEGTLPQQIDDALKAFGFRMGPCAMSDLAGLDISWRMRKATGQKAPVADALCEAGRFGQKAGGGYYLYTDGRTPTPDPDVEQLLQKVSQSLGLTRRAIAAEEITQRLIYPMINEGARILAEGIAARSADIDVVWVHGYAFPRWRGGLMHYADQVGLAPIAARLEAFSQATGDASLAPAPLLKQLATEGGSFAKGMR
jgi:3-hydroxyacyl-CoA dehydrogenase